MMAPSTSREGALRWSRGMPASLARCRARLSSMSRMANQSLLDGVADLSKRETLFGVRELLFVVAGVLLVVAGVLIIRR
jgi:hypothetical protein